MLFRFHGQCLDCGHEWDGLRRLILCGPVDHREPDTYRSYRCARCVIELCVQRQLSRSAWLRWVSQNASELSQSPLDFKASELGVTIDLQSLDVISRSPLLFGACESVSNILAGSRSRYAPVAIDIGTPDCPDCGDAMTAGDQHPDSVVCPECENPAALLTGEQHAGTVLVDYSPRC